MALADALAFLALIENEVTLRDRVTATSAASDLRPLCDIASEHGFACTPDDIRTAWRKRRMLKEIARLAAQRQ